MEKFWDLLRLAIPVAELSIRTSLAVLRIPDQALVVSKLRTPDQELVGSKPRQKISKSPMRPLTSSQDLNAQRSQAAYSVTRLCSKLPFYEPVVTLCLSRTRHQW
jgi:hypothetical protein